MKIRTDFITNSSSSSFILGMKNSRLTQAQRDAVADYVEARLLGDPVTEESFAAFCRKHYLDEDCQDYQCVRSALDSGWTPRYGEISWEQDSMECGTVRFLRGLWSAIDRATPGTIRQVKTDLSY